MIGAQGDSLEALMVDAAHRLDKNIPGRPDDFLKLLFIEMVEFKAQHIPQFYQEIFPQITILGARFFSSRAEIRDLPPLINLRAFLGLIISYFMMEWLLGEQLPPESRQHTLEHFVDIYLHGILDTGESMKTRLISIIRKEFIQLFRDKRLLALIMILPLVQMILLGYAFNNDIRDMPMAVFDQSRSAESRRLLEDYQSSDYFQLKYTVRSDAELRQLIENGQAAVALVIPPDYPAQLVQEPG